VLPLPTMSTEGERGDDAHSMSESWKAAAPLMLPVYGIIRCFLSYFPPAVGSLSVGHQENERPLHCWKSPNAPCSILDLGRLTSDN
jgi:hypothetical protein